MHDAATGVTDRAIAEDLVAIEDGPVILKPISARFEEAWAFEIQGLLVRGDLRSAAEPLVDLVFHRARPGRQALKAGVCGDDSRLLSCINARAHQRIARRVAA